MDELRRECAKACYELHQAEEALEVATNAYHKAKKHYIRLAKQVEQLDKQQALTDGRTKKIPVGVGIKQQTFSIKKIIRSNPELLEKVVAKLEAQVASKTKGE